MDIEKLTAAIKKLGEKLAKHDAKRKILTARLHYYQDLCPHKNTYCDGGGYGGPGWASVYCPDSGYL